MAVAPSWSRREGALHLPAPRLHIDVMARELVAASFSDYLKIPDCIQCGGYGWCEYIAPNEIHSEGLSPIGTQREPMGLNAVYGED